MGQVRSHGLGEGGFGRVGFAGDVGAARRVHRNSPDRVPAAAADVATIVQTCAIRFHLGHERVVGAAVVGQVGADRHGEAGFGRGTGTADVGVARRVQGNVVAVVIPTTTDVATVVQTCAIRLHLGHERVVAAVVSQVRPDGHGEGGFARVGFAADVGVARRVHRNAPAIFFAAAANVAGIHQPGAIRLHLGHKDLVVAVVGQVRSHGLGESGVG